MLYRGKFKSVVSNNLKAMAIKRNGETVQLSASILFHFR